MKTQTSLYDFFAIVVPGFLWVLLISLWCKDICQFACLNGVVDTTLFFIVCYGIGLLWHKGVEWALGKISKFIKKKRINSFLLCLRKWAGEKKCRQWLLDYRYIFRNDEYAIKRSRDKFKKEYERDGGTFKKQEKTDNRYKYYTAYYALMKNNMLNSIPVLEAQVAFLKNMVFLIPFFIIPVCCCSCSFSWCCLSLCCLASIPLILLIAFVFFLALISIQKKIYYLVWEGYEYLLNLTQDDAASPTQQDVQDGTVSPANS